LISHRIRSRQAADIKARMARDLGTAIVIHGERDSVFPAPARLHRRQPGGAMTTEPPNFGLTIEEGHYSSGSVGERAELRVDWAVVGRSSS